jgi:hypothetical protein
MEGKNAIRFSEGEFFANYRNIQAIGEYLDDLEKNIQQWFQEKLSVNL